MEHKEINADNCTYQGRRLSSDLCLCTSNGTDICEDRSSFGDTFFCTRQQKECSKHLAHNING